MTVSELKEILNKMPDDTEVWFKADLAEYEHRLVRVELENGTVWLRDTD